MMSQLDDIFPSAKAPLYRRINSEESLNYLREGDGIIGFELDQSVDQRLSGFLLLAIQKHTVYAFKSDLDEEPKLILFPPLDKLFDSTFDMLGLKVVEKRYLTNDFVGEELGRGDLRDLVRNLTPPEKDIDLPEDVSERMAQELERVKSEDEDKKKLERDAQSDDSRDEGVYNEPADDEQDDMDLPDMNDPAMDETDLNNFDDYEDGFEQDFDSYESAESDFYDDGYDEQEIVAVDWRIDALEKESFNSLSELGDFVELRLHIPKAVSTQVLNKALQSDVVVNKQMRSQDLAIMLFKRLIEDNKL